MRIYLLLLVWFSISRSRRKYSWQIKAWCIIVCRKTESARFDVSPALSNCLPRVQPKRPQHPCQWLLRRPSCLLGHKKRAGARRNEPLGAQPQRPSAQSALDEFKVRDWILLGKQWRPSRKLHFILRININCAWGVVSWCGGTWENYPSPVKSWCWIQSRARSRL